ncbi:MAG: hypothetical protein DRI57_06240 [Deltaproteobacteria bacterium]|nr:MAG: hypothetical protein DRI57_06240 [Deltaproteobacteria bacterium]
MIVIRKEQMDVFSQESLDRFEEEVIDFLQDQFPDAKEESREELNPAVHEQVKKAKSYGLETERQVVTYVTTAWLMGREFDSDFPDAQEILGSPEYSSDDKSEKLVQWTEKMFGGIE